MSLRAKWQLVVPPTDPAETESATIDIYDDSFSLFVRKHAEFKSDGWVPWLWEWEIFWDGSRLATGMAVEKERAKLCALALLECLAEDR